MAKDGPGGEKTEKPTPQRLKKARKEGQIPRTQELGTWAGAAVASALLPMLVGNAYDETQMLFLQINDVASNPVQSKVFTLLGQALAAFLWTLLPMALGLMVVTGLVIAVADYVVVRTKTMKQLKMSKYEIQQEHKQSEGDPHMKAHRRGVQMSMSRNRMMAEVADADVLLVNPTHVAVALKYEAAKGAPRVVAKGAGEVAAKLRERAAEARVPMVQDIPLARALHASCDLGQEVPPQLFTAVARVLAFVMHLGARGVRGGFHRPGFEPPDTSHLPRAGRRRAPAAAAS